MMEKYKRTIRRRVFLLSLAVLLVVGLCLYDVFWATDVMKSSAVFGFQFGISLGAGILALLQLMRYANALKTETGLKMQYNLENDERMQAIRAKAGMPMLLYTSIGMLIAAVFIGYTDSAAFFVLAKAAACQLIVGCVTKLVYMKIM